MPSGALYYISMPRGIPKNGINKGWFKSGCNHTEKWKKYLSDINKGKKPYIMTKKVLENMRKARLGKTTKKKGRKYPHLCNEINGNWKGDIACLGSKHSWINRHFGKPTVCEHCGCKDLITHKIHWSNKNHKYRRFRKDWQRLCVKCHRLWDKQKGLRK